MSDEVVPDLAATIATAGFAMVPDVLSASEREATANAIEEVLAAESDIAAQRGWHTDAYRVTYAVPLKHPTLLAAATSPALVALARAVLGPDCELAGCNGFELIAASPGQALHRDHPDPIPGTTTYLHLVCALDTFTIANGATRVVAGSHQGALAAIDPAQLEPRAEAVEVPAGGVLAFDGALAHAASANNTDRPRRALHAFFARWWAKPHWDFPASLPAGIAEALSAEQRQLLGFDHRPRRWDLDHRRVQR